jgi:hypothetical protein
VYVLAMASPLAMVITNSSIILINIAVSAKALRLPAQFGRIFFPC